MAKLCIALSLLLVAMVTADLNYPKFGGSVVSKFTKQNLYYIIQIHL